MGHRIRKESEISSISLPWLRHRLLHTIIVTRNPPPGHSVPSSLSAPSWPLGPLVNGWQEVHFLIDRRPLVNSMPCWLLCALLTALRPSGCATILLVIRHPPSHRCSFGCSAPAHRCPSTRSAYSSLSDILVVTRPSLATLRHPGYSEPFGALPVTRRFPVCPTPLACRNPQSLLTLLRCSSASFWLACMRHIPH